MKLRTQMSALWASAILATAPAFAEPPMQVDDAGTLGAGGLKIEGALTRDHKTHGGELIFGFAPLENLEIGLALSHATDREPDPSTRLRGSGIGFKWVPIQNETGWSAGVKLDLSATRVDDRVNGERYTEKEYALAALATYRFDDGQAIHANLGSKQARAQGDRATVGTWGLGHEWPLAAKLKLTEEIFGEEHSRPDKALGLRYEVFEGFKLSGAIGHGNGRRFGQIGFAWEF
ncbi:hypothetical protein [Sulfuricystis multivorans]|uniref:hypothetical protein n=1 Tax=Sulfuricystis multivorans TaxID=2211108 RepID=UPI0024DF408A|nr:hypothetical protein [Sulfuricystis multivorans]